ncbi:MerC domain-containing protein [Bernardetia sp. Wsw4-3y2]|uniref:MerC domain-containing protein n=1 Tax=Bernardetia sp. Wsw4-3y2 TaxID=3127471 RepID=UPI0030CC4EA5
MKKYNLADITGIISSCTCMIHCMLTPVFIAFEMSFVTQPIFTYFFLLISFLAILKTTKGSSNKKINILLWFSFIAFSLSTLFEDAHEGLEYVAYFFAILIIIGHILNIRYCQTCKITTTQH